MQLLEKVLLEDEEPSALAPVPFWLEPYLYKNCEVYGCPGWAGVPSELSSKKKTLVLDLDETLIHSSTVFRANSHAVLDIYLEGKDCVFYVFKRPYVDLFLEIVSRWYRLVVFTASLPEYAHPIIDYIDPKGVINARYFRDVCFSFIPLCIIIYFTPCMAPMR